MDANKFNAIKDRARKLIHEDAKQDAHIIKERQRDRNNPKFFEGQPNDAFSQISSLNGGSSSSMQAAPINEQQYVDDSEDRLYADIDARMRQKNESRQIPQQAPVMQPQSLNMANSRLPREILESFSKNYIDQSVFDPNRSVLDKMGITGSDTIPQQQQINETVQQPVSTGGKIDYELIKSIVESSVKKYINALGKKMINENNDLSMIQVGDKKINLVTKSGDVYSAKLEFVKNIKK